MLTQILGKLRKEGIMASLMRGAGTVFLIQVIGSAVGYSSQVALARWMGVSQYGLYTYIMSLASLSSTLPLLGLRGAVVRFIPEYRTKEDSARLQGVIRASWGLALGASILLALLGTGVALVINVQHPLENLVSILLGIWLMPLVTLIQLSMSMLQAFRRMTAAFAPMKVVRPALIIVGAFGVFLWQGRQLLSSITVLWITLGVFLTILLRLVWMLRQDLIFPHKEAPPIYEIPQLMRVALPLLLVTAFTSFLHQADIVMIGALVGTKSVGLYNAAVRTAGLAGFVLTAVTGIAAPMISATYAEHNPAKLQRLMTRVNQLLLLPSLAITLGILVMAKPILSVFGPEFISMQWVLITLTIAQFIRATAGPTGLLLELTGFQNDSARIRGGTAALNITLNLIGIYWLGALGAALATTISTLVEKVCLDWLVAKRIQINASLFSYLRLRQ
jgi:O-antigen/teichoic acid export membrane protein